MWHPSGTLRWYCYVCKRRFDPPPAAKRKSKARKTVLQREAALQQESEKFPTLGEVLGESATDQTS
jgi:hypothetical protein